MSDNNIEILDSPINKLITSLTASADSVALFVSFLCNDKYCYSGDYGTNFCVKNPSYTKNNTEHEEEWVLENEIIFKQFIMIDVLGYYLKYRETIAIHRDEIVYFHQKEADVCKTIRKFNKIKFVNEVVEFCKILLYKK